MNETSKEIRQNFAHPPKQFGEVAFFWWVGDKLTKERLSWQLSQLKNHHISGLQVNYCHTDKGGNWCGLPFKSDPPLFSEKWWDLFSWFLQEAKKEGIAVALSDYTLGTAGQGYFMDEILNNNPDIHGSLLTYKEIPVTEQTSISVPEFDENEQLLGAYTMSVSNTIEQATIQNERISVPKNCSKVLFVCTQAKMNSLNPMHPKSGDEMIRTFFQPFEDRNPGEGGAGLNFFFSDELNFNISGNLWDANFAEEFHKRKGYDLIPYLPAIFTDIGDITPKIRLDYYDVIVQLEEENYFSKVYNWHQERGMIYGCDHGGRGRKVTEFGDYFRTQKYNQGPGNDQPRLQADIIKNKASSSIAHMYKRPRTWLEGFYGSGWQTSSTDVADAVFRNFAMGQNLLTLHGLYYTTHGGFWEWAPPCNHFRMPYWKHMETLLGCTERISYLFSRGVHVCDVGILYPVADEEGGLNGQKAVETAFHAGELLYPNGIDFDFLDFESVARADILNKKLCISGEAYQAVIIPSMKTIRFSALQKLAQFAQEGGIIINLGDEPIASDRIGKNDAQIDSLMNTIHRSGGLFLTDDSTLIDVLDERIQRDVQFETKQEYPYILHRRTDGQNIYFIYNVPKDTVCKFRTDGNPYLYNPWNGTVSRLHELSRDNSGVTMHAPLSQKEPQIIVFEKKTIDAPFYPQLHTEQETTIDGEWNFELKPTLDNQFGDYRLPIEKSRYIGPELRRPMCKTSETENYVTIGYGPIFKKYGPYNENDSLDEIEQKLINEDLPILPKTQNYCISRRFGLEGDPGHQGYHGLKESVTDDFLTLGKPEFYRTLIRYLPEEEGNIRYFKTFVDAEQDMTAYILTGDIKPSAIRLNGTIVTDDTITLRKGRNSIILRYDECGRTHFVLSRKKDSDFVQTMPLAMTWYNNPDVIPFNLFSKQDMPTKFVFNTPPATRKAEILAREQLHITANGFEISEESAENNTIRYTLIASEISPRETKIEISANPKQHYEGDIFAEYIPFECEKGLLTAGAWEDRDGLRSYSGGAVYSKEIDVVPVNSDEHILLDLGDVCSSCEVRVNGKSVGIRVMPVWTFDITDFVKNGKNTVEIIIYNTLSNHYSTIPTMYNHPVRSGLLGPVRLVYAKEI